LINSKWDDLLARLRRHHGAARTGELEINFSSTAAVKTDLRKEYVDRRVDGARR
jgi:hypothetical protein